MSLTLTWSEKCVLTSRAYRKVTAATENTATITEINNPRNATFKIKATKLYVPVVILLDQDDNKLLEQLKAGFRRTIKWNKHSQKCLVSIELTN